MQKCSVCLEQSEEALQEMGPIVNHLVGQHTGVHAECLAKCFEKGHWRCPVCLTPLNPSSGTFFFGRKVVLLDEEGPEALGEAAFWATSIAFALLLMPNSVYMDFCLENTMPYD